jgi:SM-20-related protein
MLNLAAFHAASPRNDPFRYAHFALPLLPDAAETLEADFPHASLRESRSEAAHYLLADRTIIDRGEIVEDDTPLPDSWAGLACQLVDGAYKRAVERLLDVRLDDTALKARICRYDAGCWMLPHTDRVDRVVTQIIYLNREWDPHWGGGLRILRSLSEDDLVAEIVPAFNTSVAFVRSDTSYHSVAAVSTAARHARMSLLLQYVRD